MTESRKRVPAAKTLDEVVRQFREISDWAAALGRSHGLEVLGRRPSTGGWSAAECLEHLTMSADPYLSVWARELEECRGRDASTGEAKAGYGLDLWGRILYWTLEPPPRFRFPTKPGFVPGQLAGQSSRDWVQSVLPAFLDRQQRIIGTIESSRGLPIDRIKMVSPFDSRVRYTIWSSFCVTAAHERRHLWQAEQALRSHVRMD